MKIFLTGSAGQVGQEIEQLGQIQGFEIIGKSRQALDITKETAVSTMLQQTKPNFVVNAAAYTAVEKAESESSLAFAVNREGPRHLAKICANLKIPLIHISTDYVFDGRATTSYQETDTANPINIYGRSKWEGEQTIRQQWDQHIILRTSWVFGRYGQNFLKTMLKLAKTHKTLRIIDDIYGCPTEASDIATTILQIIHQFIANLELPWGTYHYCGNDQTNWYGFAKTIFKVAAEHQKITIPQLDPIEAKDYPSQLERPMNTPLSCQKIQTQLNIAPSSWQEGVQRVIQALPKD